VKRPVDSLSSPNGGESSLSRVDAFLESEMLLDAIAAATQPLVEPSAIMATTARLLAEHLRTVRTLTHNGEASIAPRSSGTIQSYMLRPMTCVSSRASNIRVAHSGGEALALVESSNPRSSSSISGYPI
jgi:hypothetical protein